MKFVKRLLVFILVLIVLALAALFFFAGPIVKSAVVKSGPAVMGVPVSVDKVDISLLKGDVLLQNLVIGNPKGFKTEHLFKMGRLAVKLDMSSLTKDTIIIEKIHVEQPEITYERGLLDSNLSALMKNMESAGPGEGKPAAAEKKPEPEAAPGKKVVIKDFLLADGTINVSATIAGGAAVPLPMPELRLANVGEDSNGASVKQITTIILQSVLSLVTKTVTGSADLLGKGVKAVGGTALEGVEKVGGAVGKVGGTAIEGAGAVGGAAVEGAKAVGGVAVDGAKAVGGVAVDGVKTVGGAAAKGVGKVGSAVGGGLSKLFGGAKESPAPATNEPPPAAAPPADRPLVP